MRNNMGCFKNLGSQESGPLYLDGAWVELTAKIVACRGVFAILLNLATLKHELLERKDQEI